MKRLILTIFISFATQTIFSGDDHSLPSNVEIAHVDSLETIYFLPGDSVNFLSFKGTIYSPVVQILVDTIINYVDTILITNEQKPDIIVILKDSLKVGIMGEELFYSLEDAVGLGIELGDTSIAATFEKFVVRINSQAIIRNRKETFKSEYELSFNSSIYTGYETKNLIKRDLNKTKSGIADWFVPDILGIINVTDYKSPLSDSLRIEHKGEVLCCSEGRAKFEGRIPVYIDLVEYKEGKRNARRIHFLKWSEREPQKTIIHVGREIIIFFVDVFKGLFITSISTGHHPSSQAIVPEIYSSQIPAITH